MMIRRDEFYDIAERCGSGKDVPARIGCPLLCTWPKDRASCERLAALIKGTGARGVVSVGCGCGVVEWLMSEFFLPLAVLGIDTFPAPGLLADAAKWSIAYGCALDPHSRNIVQADVSADRALAFFYPIPSSYAARYLAEFRGPCVVVAPAAGGAEDEVGAAIAKQLAEDTETWVLAGSEVWPARLSPTATVAVFCRRKAA